MADETAQTSSTSPALPIQAESLRAIPWQIWVVVVMLGLEGVGNLLAIPQVPEAGIWLAVKGLFIVGLLNKWRWVFVLFVIVAGYHVLAFSMWAPFVAFLNLMLVLLAASALRFYFPQGAGPRG